MKTVEGEQLSYMEPKGVERGIASEIKEESEVGKPNSRWKSFSPRGGFCGRLLNSHGLRVHTPRKTYALRAVGGGGGTEEAGAWGEGWGGGGGRREAG